MPFFGEIRRLVVLMGWMQTAFMSIAVGLGGGMAVNRLMGSLLFGVRPHDPATLVTVAATIAAVATLACWLPAWRAARLDPIDVLEGGPTARACAARWRV